MKKLSLLLLVVILLLAVPTMVLAESQLPLTTEELTVFEGATLQLLDPDKMSASATYTFSSSSTKRAAIDEDGLITGKSKGEVKITVTVKEDGEDTIKETVLVEVIRPVERLELDEETLQLSMGKTLTIDPKVYPKYASNTETTFTSSDPSIVMVDEDDTTGKVTGIAAGKAVITIASVTNPEIFVECTVIIVQPVKTAKSSLSEDKIYVGEQSTLVLELAPSECTVNDMVFTSSNTKVATVDENGVITAVGKGKAKISATPVEGKAKRTSKNITVIQQATSIELKEEQILLGKGKKANIRATVLPKDANSKTLTYTSSDPSIIKVDSKGRVTAKGEGQATITVASKDYPETYATCIVGVALPLDSIEVDTQQLYLSPGDTHPIAYQLLPTAAATQIIGFESSAPEVVAVDKTGTITAHRTGQATITLYSFGKNSDGEATTNFVNVSVLQPVTGIALVEESLTVAVGKKELLKVTFSPEDASNTQMTWTCSDTSVATIKGKNTICNVIGVKAGTATITGVSKDGNFQVTATITVE